MQTRKNIEYELKITWKKNVISYYEQLAAHKFDNLDETDQTLERYK